MMKYATKTYSTIIILTTVIYLAYVNFNLPFLTIDELNGNIFSLKTHVYSVLHSGRISHLFNTPTHLVLSFRAPTVIELLPRFFSMIFLLFTLVLYLRHLSFGTLMSVLMAVFIILTHSLDWQHNGMIAFFGTYNMYFSFFILSIIMFEKNINNNVYINLLTFVFLLLSFASEIYVGLAFVYLLLHAVVQNGFRKIHKNPFFYALILYIVFFVLSKQYMTDAMNDYLVGSLSNSDVLSIVKGTLLYLINSLPLYTSLHINSQTSFILSILFAAVVIGLFVLKYKNNYKNILFIHSLVMLLLFITPQFLMALQPMKLEWILSEVSHRYVFSFYAWIALVLLTIFLLQNIHINKKITFIFIISMTFFVFSSVKENILFVKEYSTSMNNWREIDKIFNDTPQNTDIKIPSSLLVHPYVSPVSVEYIKRYGQHFYHRKVLVCSPTTYFDFSSPIDHIIKLEGFSSAESKGRWTEGATAKITFPNKLHAHEFIKITLKDVFGENRVLPISFKIGQTHKLIVVSADKEILIEVSEDIENPVLEIGIPKPVSPLESGIGSDTRKLGIMIKDIKIGTTKDGEFQIQTRELCR